jgi:hypothetical protein
MIRYPSSQDVYVFYQADSHRSSMGSTKAKYEH